MNNLVKKARIKAIILYNIFFFITTVIFYFLLPIMLNYPPNSINNEFEKTIDMGMHYDTQYLIIIVFAIAACNIYFITQLKSVEKYREYTQQNDSASKAKLDKIKKKCFYLPAQIYIIHATIPNISIFTFLILSGAKLSLAYRIVLLTFSFMLVLGLLAYIFSKNVFTEILVELGNRETYEGKGKMRFRARIFLLFVPLFFLTLLFTITAADTLLSKERGRFIHENYASQIETQKIKNATTVDEAISMLGRMKKYETADTLFVITKQQTIYADNDTEISDFFRKYTFDVAKDGHTYGYYASNIEGTFMPLKIDGTMYAVGIMYSTESLDIYTFLMYTALTLILLSAFFLAYFIKEISEQIVDVSTNITKIANEKFVDYEKKMPVISNDEFGELVIAFNKILDLEKEHTHDMEKNQEILVEQERLSSLGQLIGGIAHNLKTPIMSISGASQAIKELASEYERSIGNPQVTPEDHREIAKEMNEWNEKIGTYLTYMTEVINTAKGQAVSMNASTVNDFTMEELLMRVQILMKEGLMQRGCALNIENNLDKNLKLKGELSAIVQVLDNLIINAADAYGKNSGQINLKLSEDNEKVYIQVEDFAGGIPEDVQEKLFRQMITTKGKNGTGLGLYMCYSTIKGKFNGEMTYKTEMGKGTIFSIELNKNKQ